MTGRQIASETEAFAVREWPEPSSALQRRRFTVAQVLMSVLWSLFCLVAALGCSARVQGGDSPPQLHLFEILVRDSSGAALPDVNVTVFWLATGRFVMTKTDATGGASIEIPDFGPARVDGDRYRYRLVLGLQGYRKHEEEGTLAEPSRGRVSTYHMVREEKK